MILAGWPYTYFVVQPLNIWLYALPSGEGGSVTRELVREWGVLEWGQTAIGIAATALCGWSVALLA